jgi:hypothetical protein
MVGVVDHVSRPAAAQGHVQGVQHQLRAQVCGHGPTDHAPAPGVQHDRQEEEAGRGRDVGNVGHPEAIGAGRVKLPLDEIRRGRRGRVAACGDERPAPAHALQAGGAHQAGDPLAAELGPLGGEFRVHARRTVGPTRLPMDRLDLRCELHIGAGAGRQGALAPRVVPAGGDFQHAAHRGDRMKGLMGGHELESFDGIDVVSRANQAAAS